MVFKGCSPNHICWWISSTGGHHVTYRCTPRLSFCFCHPSWPCAETSRMRWGPCLPDCIWMRWTSCRMCLSSRNGEMSGLDLCVPSEHETESRATAELGYSSESQHFGGKQGRQDQTCQHFHTYQDMNHIYWVLSEQANTCRPSSWLIRSANRTPPAFFCIPSSCISLTLNSFTQLHQHVLSFRIPLGVALSSLAFPI